MLENLEKYRAKPAHISLSKKHLKHLDLYDSAHNNKGVQVIFRSANEAGILADVFFSYEDYVEYRKALADPEKDESKTALDRFSSQQFFPWSTVIAIDF